MRVFAALPLPTQAVEAIRRAIAAVSKEHVRLRWVSDSAYHLTLHFFGDLEDAALAALRQVLDDPRLRRPAILTGFGPVGQFPNEGNPRVVWVALSDDHGELRSYWELFESAIAPLGHTPDPRGFTPHITLARNPGVRLPQGWDSSVALPPGLQFSVDECVLFQSILGRGGSQYVRLKSISLDGGGT